MSKPPPPPPGPVLNVTTNNTTVTGTVNGETINALGANDTIIAGPGYEYLNAGGANDTLEGAIGSASFTGLAGSSNSTLVALPSRTTSLPGVDVSLKGLASAGVTITGTIPDLVTVSYQQAPADETFNITNLTVSNNGDNILDADVGGGVLTVNGNGNNLLEGSGFTNNTLVANGTGNNMFWGSFGGTNTMTGGSGNNYYYEEAARSSTKDTSAEYYNNTITDFNTATDTLQFQITNTFTDHHTTIAGVDEAPTSWTLISVNGVASLRAVLGDGVSTLTLLGVTDPSHIHMEGVDGGVVTQLPDVPIAGAAQFASAMAGMGGGAAAPLVAGSPVLAGAHPVLMGPRMAQFA